MLARRTGSVARRVICRAPEVPSTLDIAPQRLDGGVAGLSGKPSFAIDDGAEPKQDALVEQWQERRVADLCHQHMDAVASDVHGRADRNRAPPWFGPAASWR